MLVVETTVRKITGAAVEWNRLAVRLMVPLPVIELVATCIAYGNVAKFSFTFDATIGVPAVKLFLTVIYSPFQTSRVANQPSGVIECVALVTT